MSTTIQQAIEKIRIRYKTAIEQYHKAIVKKLYQAANDWGAEYELYELVLAALREKLARENPEPLTMEELRQMDGELVWLEVIDPTEKWLPDFSDWARVHINEISEVWFDVFGNDIGAMPEESNHGKTWNAYRHKPKEKGGT